MDAPDEQTETADQPTVQNAEGATDDVDGAPHDEQLSPQQKAARTRAAKKAAAENTPSPKDLAPPDLRADDRVDSHGGQHDKDAIVHLYEFGNGYSAKVYQRQRDGVWAWAPMRDGNIVRNIPGLGRVPAEATVGEINDGLALIAALEA